MFDNDKIRGIRFKGERPNEVNFTYTLNEVTKWFKDLENTKGNK